MAILLYKQGVRELEKAVNLNIDPNGNWRHYLSFSFYSFLWSIDNRAVELHGKMRKNLAMARERVHVLRRFPSM